MSKGTALAFDGAAKRFGDVVALAPTSLRVEPGEFLTLLGPSGSGKTTLLNLTAGYLEPSAGRVLIAERDVTHVPARQRNVGMVFQNFALFPHMTVANNVAYGLKVRRLPREEIARRVDAALALVQLVGLGERQIHQLSGGQQQRVALARALVIEPDVLLMDEPLGALDRQLRKAVQLELRRLHEEHGRTTIYVTHDQEEALVLSDRVAVMRNGSIEQIGTATELYARPANAFVAGFIGESNLLPAKVLRVTAGEAQAEVAALGAMVTAAAAPGLAPGPAMLLLRPEHLLLEAKSGVEAEVEQSVYLGELVALHLRLSGGTRLWLRRQLQQPVARGDHVRVGWMNEQLRLLPEA
ncbi:MAG: ABC transporter ATP-binding protein [Alphaproteobacteria bacterium]|nr:ABC transporter ATP-binding protein [Alphaproteobacteria bacterium]